MPSEHPPSGFNTPFGRRLSRHLPILQWIKDYNWLYLSGDLNAGLVVAIMLVPQAMAYALLAGLPPQIGLYASLLPLTLYGLFGTSSNLSVGPVAIVSILTASAVGGLATEGSAQYISLALTLALLVGVVQAGMGLLRLGFVVNFISHPVLVGFSSAAGLVIGFSQVRNLLGLTLPRTDSLYRQVLDIIAQWKQINLPTVGLSLTGIGILLYFKHRLSPRLQRLGLPELLTTVISKSGPLVIVTLGTLLVAGLGLEQRAGIKIVGHVPGGLPHLTWPAFDLSIWEALLPTALAISFVSYMESISVAKALAGRKRRTIDVDQELIALGLANLGAALTGGYPVTGGFSRSMVNNAAGAQTGLASLISALLVAISILFLTPLFYYIPNAMLAAIIVVAVVGLIDVPTMRRVWRYSRQDGVALFLTFAAVLLSSVETGILIGAAASLFLFIWRTSNPHVVVVGRLGQSEAYHSVDRYPVTTWPEVALIRVDASLYFGNVQSLESSVLAMATANAQLRQAVLIGTAINEIDYSALETLETLLHELRTMGVDMHLAAVKTPVLKRLTLSGFVENLGADHIHMTTHEALRALGYVT